MTDKKKERKSNKFIGDAEEGRAILKQMKKALEGPTPLPPDQGGPAGDAGTEWQKTDVEELPPE